MIIFKSYVLGYSSDLSKLKIGTQERGGNTRSPTFDSLYSMMLLLLKVPNPVTGVIGRVNLRTNLAFRRCDIDGKMSAPKLNLNYRP